MFATDNSPPTPSLGARSLKLSLTIILVFGQEIYDTPAQTQFPIPSNQTCKSAIP